jgi:hypothetical protein
MNPEDSIPESTEPLPEPNLIHGQVTLSNGPTAEIPVPEKPDEAREPLPPHPAFLPPEPPRRDIPISFWVAGLSLAGNLVLAVLLWMRPAATTIPARGQPPGLPAAASGPPQGSPEAFQVALKPYLDAAQAGDTSAMRMLGAMYYHGLDLPRNRTEGLKWYRKAAESGSKIAREELRQLE